MRSSIGSQLVPDLRFSRVSMPVALPTALLPVANSAPPTTN